VRNLKKSVYSGNKLMNDADAKPFVILNAGSGHFHAPVSPHVYDLTTSQQL